MELGESTKASFEDLNREVKVGVYLGYEKRRKRSLKLCFILRQRDKGAEHIHVPRRPDIFCMSG
jgi:hypothetical protein